MKLAFHIFRLFTEFFYFSLAALVPIGIVCIDLFILNNTVGEESLIEYTQGIFLLIMMILFFRLSLNFSEKRGGLLLITGFLLTILIREFDSVFDLLYRRSWFYFAIIVVFLSIIYAFKRRETITYGLQFFTSRREYGVFLAGLLILIVFSRLLGKGALWMFVLGSGYERVVKNIIEETTELLGYSFMLLATIKFYKWAMKFRQD